MSSEAHLEVRFRRRRIGSLALDVSFTTAAPWTILFGPSGSGKSSILRVIAGFETPLDPTTFVRIADTVVHNRETGVYIPAWRRNIRLAAQKVALYSHMTVEQNLAFGLEAEAAGLTGRGLIDEVGRALELFQLQALAGKKPRELSGGESQKVAIVRAAIGAPGKLLLLDEHFRRTRCPRQRSIDHRPAILARSNADSLGNPRRRRGIFPRRRSGANQCRKGCRAGSSRHSPRRREN